MPIQSGKLVNLCQQYIYKLMFHNIHLGTIVSADMNTVLKAC